MSTIAEHHTALQVRLDTLDGLRAFDHPPQGANPPVAFVQLVEWEPTSFARAGHKRYVYEVYVLTAESIRPKDGYELLMEYADQGSKSVDLAIWDGNDRPNGTFGGYADTQAQVIGFRVLGSQEVDELEMYGGVFTVEVLTKKGA